MDCLTRSTDKPNDDVIADVLVKLSLHARQLVDYLIYFDLAILPDLCLLAGSARRLLSCSLLDPTSVFAS